MNFLKFLKEAFAFINSILDFKKRKELIDLGSAKVQNEVLTEEKKNVTKANKARKSVSNKSSSASSSSLFDDPYNRD